MAAITKKKRSPKRDRRRGGRGGHDNTSQIHENFNPRKDKSMIKCYSCAKYGHYAAEYRNKECDEEANLMFTDNEEPTLMLDEKMSNQLMLNEEKVMTNPFIDGEDQMKTSMWYLNNGVSNHMTENRAKFK